MSTVRDRVLDGALVVVALSTVVVAGILAQQHLFPSAMQEGPKPVPGWETYAQQGRRLGPLDAPVTIIEWGDYQCPACRGWQPHIEAILRKYPNNVAFVYRHWPLEIHQFAYAAARAAECAGHQGRFWEVHRELLAENNWLGDAITRMAGEAGVEDMARFQSCMSERAPVRAIEEDIAAARALNARGTPTIILNGMMLGSSRDSLALEEMILAAIVR